MTTDDRSSGSPPRTWARGLLVAGLLGVVLGIATSRYASRPLARTLFGRVPVGYLLDLDAYRAELTREFALAFVAGFIGPTDSPSEPSPATPAKKTPEPADADTPTSESPPSPTSPSGAPASDQPTTREGTSLEFTIDRRELNRRLKNPNRIRDHVSLVSERGPDNRPVGIRILELEEWFGQFGLRAGDVVRAVNDTRITTRQQAIATLAGMREKTNFTLDVVRNDNSFQIRYRVPHVDN